MYRTVLAASESVVLVGENAAFDDDHIVAYDPGSGEEWWRLPVSSRAGVSLPDEGSVDVVAFEVGSLEAPYVVGVELSSGTERWATEIGLTLIAQSAEIVVLARPNTIENNQAVGGVIGVDRESGEQRWVNDELVYQATDGGIARTDTALAGDIVAVRCSTSQHHLRVAC